MNKKRVAIVGSHGLYAKYGGWDQLVKNLAEKKSEDVEYLIFNSKETSVKRELPSGVKIRRLRFKASGIQGLFYDFWSIITCFFKVDTILFLGVQGIPIVPFLQIFKRFNVVSNVGGIEWERPKFGFFSKLYLRWCFNLSFKYSSTVILDNEHYKKYAPKKSKARIAIIPYGGEINKDLEVTKELLNIYPFLNRSYFLSISRALEDNLIDRLCESFITSQSQLVLISNFDSSKYGRDVYNKYKEYPNLTLINGLYHKAQLDLIRRCCTAYIHTHTLCGTAPSLVEMIISRKPILSINIPQNKYTLHNQAFFFDNFQELHQFIEDSEIDLVNFISDESLIRLYSWDKIVGDYEALY